MDHSRDGAASSLATLQEEALFRSLAVASPVGILYATSQGECLYTNTRWHELSGLSYEASLGLGWLQAISPDDRAAFTAAWTDATNAGHELTHEFRLGHQSDGPCWMRVRAMGIRTPGGAVAGYVGTIEDITDSKRALEELRAERDFGLQVMSTIGQGLTVTNATGRFEYVNPAFARMLGEPPDGLVGKAPRDIVTEESREMVEEGRARHLRGETTTHEVQLVAGDGRIVHALVTAAPRFRQGAFAGSIAVVTDLSDLRRAEDELRAQRDFAIAVMNTIGQGVTVTDASGRFEYVNPAFAAMLGRPVDDILGRTPYDVAAPAAHQAMRRARTLQRKGELSTFEVEYARPDGSTVHALVTVSPRMRAGRFDGTIAAVTDLTERKAAEDAARESHGVLTKWVNELEQRNQQVTLLSEMIEYLQSCDSQPEAYAIINQFLPSILVTGSGAVMVLSPSAELLEPVTTWGTPPPARLFSPQDCWAIRRGRTHGSGRSPRDLPCRHLEPHPPAGSLCIPIMAHGEVLGILHLNDEGATTDAPRVGGGQAQHNLAHAVAEQIGLALMNLRLRETLRQQSVRDALTGLFNRRYMEESLTRELHRATRESAAVSIIMLDIDHFKRFNDDFGHAAGDSMLRTLAGVLRDCVRADDIACRYGGEEFVLILPGASIEVAKSRAEALRRTAEQMTISQLGQGVTKFTLSLGVAAFPHHGTTTEDLLRAADAALYRAKDEGRNRVVMAPIRAMSSPPATSA